MNRAGLWLVPLALFAGCAVGPNYQSPQTPMPGGWAGPSASGEPMQLATWWQGFQDPKLTALVEEALKANLDMQLAAARLREARYSRSVAAGALWPAVNASADIQRTRQGTAGDQNLFQTGLDAVWEMDLFGGIRRNVESATANVDAAREGERDVQVSLAAEVAVNYLQLRGAQQQILISEENLEAQRHTADITRQRFDAGFVSGLDVANAEAQVATTASIIPLQESAAQQAIYALSVLLARPPADLLNELSETGPLPPTPPEVPAGLPSELLRRRPDIRQAESLLHAATAQIGVATADLFPKFSLTGSLNWQAGSLSDLNSGAARSWLIGPSVQWPIFQGGSLVANVHVQEALRDQAYITYQKTVLAALQDVENALIAYAKEGEHRRALNDAVASNRKAVRLAMQLYTQGQTDFLSVLDAQRSLYVTEDAYVQSLRDTGTNLIALYKALGGGWDVQPVNR